jgi:hypothetical protein
VVRSGCFSQSTIVHSMSRDWTEMGLPAWAHGVAAKSTSVHACIEFAETVSFSIRAPNF